ncbi:translation initiation factor IF-2, partial [Acidobacterium sp.]
RPAGVQPGSQPAVSVQHGAEAQKPAPRRIVPQPRQPSAVVAPPPAATPAIAARPPAAPVAVKPPVTTAPIAQQEKPAAPAAQEVKSALATGPSVPVAVSPSVVVAAAPPPATAFQAPAAPAAPAASQSAPQEAKTPAAEAPPVAPEKPAVPAPPQRRVIMPQTGPRPVYTAPPPSASPVTPRPSGGGIQRGKPIFDRRPTGNSPGGPGGPGGGYGQRPSGPGGRRPMHPTRNQPGGGPPGGRPGFNNGPRPGFGQRPGGFGQRPGMGAPGLVPPPGDTPGRPQRPGAGQKRGGRSNQYPKSKEGPMKGFAPPSRFGGAQIPTEPLPITRTITVTEGISVKDLAEKLGVRGKDLIATLLMRGVFVTVNQSLDGELVKDVARQFGADTTVISFEDQMANEAFENLLSQENPDELELSRPPVVTVMGHVDHGKTSLLDAIRETDVAGGEAGGITQHIGAYKVRINKEDSPAFGREIVFLDTPGHEAFTRMRARGAKVTDIVVIVVAADDGVMPQTLEAVDHAKAANVPIIVAVNKIDKPEAQPDRVKKQLGDRGLVPEDWGGSTVFVDVSAKKRQNLDLLLEMICLVADLGNLKATPGRSAVGTVIEAKLDRGRGAVASVLVQNGTLRAQDSFIVGNTFGKIRAMFDDRGRAIEEAGPSTPVEILGLENMPDAGDTFLVVADRDKAKGIAQYRQMKEREVQLAKSSRVSLEGLAEQIKQAGMKELPLILKGDVTGSVEVLADSLQKMSTEKVRIKVIHSGVGAITESDVLLASASNAIIIGFNVKPDRKSADLAEQENVEIRLHTIIYELQEEITKAMLGLLDPVFKESYLGRAEVLNVFKIPKIGTIAGCRVLDGVLRRDSEIRLMRGGEQVFKGKLTSLKRFKDDAKEVTNGMECGVGLNTSDIQVGDTVEAFTMERVAAELTAQ